jgi:hypothetical protein
MVPAPGSLSKDHEKEEEDQYHQYDHQQSFNALASVDAAENRHPFPICT